MLLEDELVADEAVEPPIPEYFEIVRGQIVEVSPMSFYAGEVANDLKTLFDSYLTTNKVGRTRYEQNFAIPQPDDETRVMRPDLAFISFDRWPRERPIPLEGLGIRVVPELAIEVISPSDKAEDVMQKMRDYLRGGVSLVWQIFPINRFTLVFDGSSSFRIVREDEDLTLPFLPGFSFKLTSILPIVDAS